MSERYWSAARFKYSAFNAIVEAPPVLAPAEDVATGAAAIFNTSA